MRMPASAAMNCKACSSEIGFPNALRSLIQPTEASRAA